LVQTNQFPELNRHILTFFCNKVYCWESHTGHRWIYSYTTTHQNGNQFHPFTRETERMENENQPIPKFDSLLKPNGVWFFDAQTITFRCLYTTTHQSSTTHQSPSKVMWNVSRWHVAMKIVWTTQRLSMPPTKKSRLTYMWSQMRVMRFLFWSR
jgi:hypothetical protein